MKGVHKFLLKNRLYSSFIEWTKAFVIPGFGPLPLYTICSFFFQEIARDSLANKASSLAYSFMLAIFPTIIFIFTLIPYIPVDGFQNQLMNQLKLVFPTYSYLAVRSTLEDIINKQNGGVLSFGFVAALFFATNGITNLMKAFNKSSLIIESRGWLRQRLVAIALTFVLFFALVIGLGIITFSEVAIAKIQKEFAFNKAFYVFLVAAVRWFILIAIYFVTISILYRYGPAHTKKWKLFSPGAWLASALALFTFWGFGFYINNFTNFNRLYGSIGTIIVVMIWLYLNSFIILLGFEFNASIDLSKRSIKIVKPLFNSFRREPVEETITKNTIR
ncbi:YihY/virulence factor BrkB family protein [Desertivirga arenae]|uniref:YihY/virulence factor BrkB family protein n=1 Tax=Desertivirga arenae TaxID=2810309 RepID=UPI001A95F37D|nr:YihY/virulence factor BrkB family protein [Pedobacter sp. SYSU D00823]